MNSRRIILFCQTTPKGKPIEIVLKRIDLWLSKGLLGKQEADVLRGAADVLGHVKVEKRKPEVERRKHPLLVLAGRLCAALWQWARAGFPIASGWLYARRRWVCERCPAWDSRARWGLGKCNDRKCGCTKFKLWLTTEKCPRSKW